MSRGVVYVETSVISYLTARSSKQAIARARQQITQDWWDHERAKYEVYISQEVLREAGRGDRIAAAERLEVLSRIPLLGITPEIADVASKLLKDGVVPMKAADDALHIAIAAFHGADYLLTWNFKHINNVHQREAISQSLNRMEMVAPVLCSPEELCGG